MSFTNEIARGAVLREGASLFLGPNSLSIVHPESDLEISVPLTAQDHVKLATRHLAFAEELQAKGSTKAA